MARGWDLISDRTGGYLQERKKVVLNGPEVSLAWVVCPPFKDRLLTQVSHRTGHILAQWWIHWATPLFGWKKPRPHELCYGGDKFQGVSGWSLRPLFLTSGGGPLKRVNWNFRFFFWGRPKVCPVPIMIMMMMMNWFLGFSFPPTHTHTPLHPYESALPVIPGLLLFSFMCLL